MYEPLEHNDNEGADITTFDAPGTPELFGEENQVSDDFAINHDEVELVEEELAEEAGAEFVPVDFNLDETEPSDDDLHELESDLEEAA